MSSKKLAQKGPQKRSLTTLEGSPSQSGIPTAPSKHSPIALDGQLRSSTNTDGTTTSITYDVFGRETSVTILSFPRGPAKEPQRIHHVPPRSRHRSQWQHYRILLRRRRPSRGRRIPSRGQTERTEYAYDTLGRLFSTRKGDEVQVVDRDLLGRTIEERVENSAGDVLRKTCTSYNAAGDVERVCLWIDDKESQEYFFYDGFHRLIQHLDPLGNKTQYSYDENALDDSGRRVLQKTTIDPVGVQTIETFDVLGRLTHILKRAPSRRHLPKKSCSTIAAVTSRVIYTP